MDSKLEGVFRTNLYTTEKIDTRMGIRHQDPEAQKRQSRDPKDEEEGVFGDDHTTLSVAALHGFLNSLLQQAGQTPKQQEPENTAPTPHPAGAMTQAQQSGYAAAANAYQSTAQSGSSTAIPLNDPPVTTAQATATIDLSEDELNTIRQLLKDVETLAARGIATINLRPAESFLQSLSAGVAEALGAE